MRHFITIITLLLSLCVYAQKTLQRQTVQNTFFGVSFGDSKDSLFSIMQSRNLHIREFREGYYLSGTTFGGEVWNTANFYVGNDSFLRFVCTKIFRERQEAQDFFINVSGILKNKYPNGKLAPDVSFSFKDCNQTTLTLTFERPKTEQFFAGIPFPFKVILDYTSLGYVQFRTEQLNEY